jgi:hypothetical protein
MCKEWRTTMGFNSGLKVGEIIDALNLLSPSDRLYFGYFSTKTLTTGFLESYRGYYEDLSVIPKETNGSDAELSTVGGFRDGLIDALTKRFKGYKGGSYAMSRNSTFWVSEWGCCDERYIVRFESQKSGRVRIITKKQ